MREPGVELSEGGGSELIALEGAFGVLICLSGGTVAGWGDWRSISVGEAEAAADDAYISI